MKGNQWTVTCFFSQHSEKWQSLGSAHRMCSKHDGYVLLEDVVFLSAFAFFLFLTASVRSSDTGGRRWKRQRCRWQLCDANSSCGVNMPLWRHGGRATWWLVLPGGHRASSGAVVKTSEMIWVSSVTSHWHHSGTGLNSNSSIFLSKYTYLIINVSKFAKDLI